MGWAGAAAVLLGAGAAGAAPGALAAGAGAAGALGAGVAGGAVAGSAARVSPGRSVAPARQNNADLITLGRLGCMNDKTSRRASQALRNNAQPAKGLSSSRGRGLFAGLVEHLAKAA